MVENHQINPFSVIFDCQMAAISLAMPKTELLGETVRMIWNALVVN